MKNKLLVICGPTATGKTHFALHLAKLLEGELITADARQIYKGLDILTGKDIPDGYTYKYSDIFSSGKQIGFYGNGTKIWLVDFFDRNELFNASLFRKAAFEVIVNIRKREKLPILVGGSGLYISSVLSTISNFDIPPNSKLRKKLSSLSLGDLQVALKNKDAYRFDNMNDSDKKNPRRLIRALETLNYTKQKNTDSGLKNYDILQIGLTAPIEFLEGNIKNRMELRIEQGVFEEIKLFPLRTNFSFPADSALGYTILQRVNNGEITVDEGKKLWYFKERQYAKRQLTWFKKSKDIVWYDISLKSTFSKMTHFIATWYTR